MKKNVGYLDQVLRLGISVILIYIGYVDEHIVHDSLSRWILLGIGIVNLVVAVSRYCPLYVLVGITTCPNHIKK